MDEKRLLTVEEAAHSLRLSRAATFRLLRDGELESLQIGRYRRITPQMIDAFIERQRAGALAGATS